MVSPQRITVVLLIGTVFCSANVFHQESGQVIPDGDQWLGYLIVLHCGGWELLRKVPSSAEAVWSSFLQGGKRKARWEFPE